MLGEKGHDLGALRAGLHPNVGQPQLCGLLEHLQGGLGRNHDVDNRRLNRQRREVCVGEIVVDRVSSGVDREDFVPFALEIPIDHRAIFGRIVGGANHGDRGVISVQQIGYVIHAGVTLPFSGIIPIPYLAGHRVRVDPMFSKSRTNHKPDPLNVGRGTLCDDLRSAPCFWTRDSQKEGNSMTARVTTLTRPKSITDYRATTRHREIGYGLAALGLLLAVVALIANIDVANSRDAATAAETLAWSFGVTTSAFGTIKLGIGVVLVGILIRLWLRVESVKVGLTALKPSATGKITPGPIKTASGPATASVHVPRPLPIHKMARTMWAPMLAMGYMALIAGLVASFVWSANMGTAAGFDAQAWTAGLQFFGEGILLVGISFLLGSILASLRGGT